MHLIFSTKYRRPLLRDQPTRDVLYFSTATIRTVMKLRV